MKAFSFNMPRTRVAKVLVGVAAIAFLMRIVMGVGNQPVLFGVSVTGYEQFIYVALMASAVLILWDIRDKLVGN